MIPSLTETLLAEENARLKTCAAELMTRLEMNFGWINGERVPLEPGSIPDGIECRDETIKGQDQQLEKQRASIATLRATIEVLKGALVRAEDGLTVALQMVEIEHFIPNWDYLREMRSRARQALAQAAEMGEGK